MRDQPITQRDEFGGVGADVFVSLPRWRPCGNRTVATTVSRCTSRPAQNSTTSSISNLPTRAHNNSGDCRRKVVDQRSLKFALTGSTTGCPQPSAPYFFPGSRAPSGVGVSPAAAVISISRPGQHRNTDERHQRRILISSGAPAQPGPSILYC